jgi:hypothetical protein
MAKRADWGMVVFVTSNWIPSLKLSIGTGNPEQDCSITPPAINPLQRSSQICLALAKAAGWRLANVNGKHFGAAKHRVILPTDLLFFVRDSILRLSHGVTDDGRKTS